MVSSGAMLQAVQAPNPAQLAVISEAVGGTVIVKETNFWHKKHEKTGKTEKPKIQETLHKSGSGLMFMGFW